MTPRPRRQRPFPARHALADRFPVLKRDGRESARSEIQRAGKKKGRFFPLSRRNPIFRIGVPSSASSFWQQGNAASPVFAPTQGPPRACRLRLDPPRAGLRQERGLGAFPCDESRETRDKEKQSKKKGDAEPTTTAACSPCQAPTKPPGSSLCSPRFHRRHRAVRR